MTTLFNLPTIDYELDLAAPLYNAYHRWVEFCIELLALIFYPVEKYSTNQKEGIIEWLNSIMDTTK